MSHREPNADTRSNISGVSAYTDISIDPIVRMKAEKILEYQKDMMNANNLEVIKEEATKDCKAQEAQVEVVEESSSKPKTATEFYAQELASMRL